MRVGTTLSVSGKVGRFGNQIQMESPEYEMVKPNAVLIHTGRLVPVYSTTAGITSKWLRSRINWLVKNFIVEEILPLEIISKHNLMALATAIKSIHFPQNLVQVEAARNRLAFDELLITNLKSQLRRKIWQTQTQGIPLKINQPKIAQFINSLPFKLTNAQNKAVEEISADLAISTPMNRLLEGDVGSGKTVVAAIALFINAENGFTGCLMAPTQLLAEQTLSDNETGF